MNNSSVAAATTTSPPAPLPNSALPVGGSDDAVVPFSPVTAGRWIVKFRQFIPATFSGEAFVLMLNQYDDACTTCSWSVQLSFNSSTGRVSDTGASGALAFYSTGQWVDIRIIIDLDTDTQWVIYDGTVLYTGTWSSHVSSGGATAIGALDLFGNASSDIYYDDFSISEWTPATIPWSDDFESYTSGTILHGLNGWQGWANDPYSASTTTNSPPGPLPNSAMRIEGSDDSVVQFAPVTTGQWIVRLRQFIPSTFSGQSYLVLFNEYDDGCSSCNWALQVYFDGTTGDMIDSGIPAATPRSYISDQWIDIMIEIDLDANTQRMLYNGTEFYATTWNDHVSGGGPTEIAAIDLYANGSTEVFYDDFSITQKVVPAPPWTDDFESYAHGTVLQDVNGWQGWANSPTYAALTTAVPPAPLPNSALRIEGLNDQVVAFDPPSSGLWVVQFRQFIPSDFSGETYLIMFNQYDAGCTSCNWSLQVSFDATTGQMQDTGASGASRAYLPDQWVDVQIEIDLDADTQRMLYNGTEFYTGSWSGHVTGSGVTEIAGLDLFANMSGAVYYDDFSVTQTILPVELVSFAARVHESRVVLSWSTATETENAGFAIEQGTDDGTFQEIGFMEGHGTTREPQQYAFEVDRLAPGPYKYRLRQIDFDGHFEYSPVVEAVLPVPDQIWIEKPYPNPFARSTTFRLAVPVEQTVTVSLVNAAGQRVRTLFQEKLTPERLKSLTINADDLPSGTYFLRILGQRFVAAERIVLTR
jgi:hypothetical protein